jgi:3D (Asp-Asp-Asp) domain-containing protein
MPITSTQSNHHVRNVAVGRYLNDGTAAAFKITTGFQPRYVKVMNVAATASMMEWSEGMAAASSIKTVAAGTRTVPTTNGITVAADGFTVGLDTGVNISNEQLSWIALG